MKGIVILALAASTKSAFSLSKKEVSKAESAEGGVPTTINQGPFSPPKPAEDKMLKIRKAVMSKLEETEKALKQAQEANMNRQVLSGLRQDVRHALQSVQDVNASYLAPRAVNRVVATLLKSISDDARSNLEKARQDGRINVLNKALAQAAGQSMEVDWFAGILNATPGADMSLIENRFRKEESLKVKEVLDQAYARERAQFNLNKARIGFGKARDDSMRKAYETALSAGVDEKVLAPTKQHLKAIDARVEAIEEIRNASKRKGIDALEEAVEKGTANGVNPLLLRMANSRLSSLKKEEKRQEEKTMTKEMKKMREEEILELRNRQAESDKKMREKEMSEDKSNEADHTEENKVTVA